MNEKEMNFRSKLDDVYGSIEINGIEFWASDIYETMDKESYDKDLNSDEVEE